jgi:hypothetical protein
MNVVLKHPRCINCHGVYADLHDNPTTLHPQPGGHIPQNAMGVSADQCNSCHDLSDASGDGKWRLPPPNMFFNRPDVEVCRAFKSTGSGAGTDFLNHLAADRLILLGFEGKKAQTDKPAEPPPISHEAFLKLGEAWIAAVYGTASQQEWAGAFPGEAGSACGCDASLAQDEAAEPGGTFIASDFIGEYVGTIKYPHPEVGSYSCELKLTIDNPPLVESSTEFSMRAFYQGDKCLGRLFDAAGTARMEGGVFKWQSQPSWMDEYSPQTSTYILDLTLNGDLLTGAWNYHLTNSDGSTRSEQGELEMSRTE